MPSQSRGSRSSRPSLRRYAIRMPTTRPASRPSRRPMSALASTGDFPGALGKATLTRAEPTPARGRLSTRARRADSRYRGAVPIALRIVAPLLALLVGAAIGTVSTFAHASLVPWVLAAGLVIVAAYVLGVRLAFDERMPGVAAAVGVGAAVVLIAVAPV